MHLFIYFGFPFHLHSQDFLSEEEVLYRFKLVRFYVFIFYPWILGILVIGVDNNSSMIHNYQFETLINQTTIEHVIPNPNLSETAPNHIRGGEISRGQKDY